MNHDRDAEGGVLSGCAFDGLAELRRAAPAAFVWW